MNKLHIAPWLLIYFVSFFFFSCNNEALEGQFGEVIEEEEIEDPNEFAVFEVELDGELFVATSIVAISGEDGLQIEASNGSKKFFILLPNPFVNNFSLDPSTNQAFMSYQIATTTSTGGEIFISQSGSFNVTNFSDEVNIISGTFSGSLQEAIFQENGIQMTNGVFQDIVFFNENIVDPTNPNNTFMTASINQTLFNATDVIYSTSSESANITGTQTNQQLQLTFLANPEVGEFSLDTQGFSATYLVDGNPQEATDGNISFSIVQENYIQGSFEFTTANSSIQAGDFGVVIN